MNQKQYILIAITALAISLVSFCPAYSQQDTIFEADAGVTGTAYNVVGSKAKFHEYSDTRSEAFHNKLNLFNDTPDYFLRFQAKDMGYDNQHYRVEGGPYGIFKAWLDYNEIIHNLTSDAKTFHSGVGGGLLVGSANTNPAAWASTFDYY